MPTIVKQRFVMQDNLLGDFADAQQKIRILSLLQRKVEHTHTVDKALAKDTGCQCQARLGRRVRGKRPAL